MSNKKNPFPICNISSPSSGSSFSMTDTIVIVVEAYDWYRPIVNVEIAESSPYQVIANLNGKLRNESNWWIYSWEWQNHTAGTYLILANAYNDNYAEVSSPAISITITTNPASSSFSTTSESSTEQFSKTVQESSATAEESSMQGSATTVNNCMFFTFLALLNFVV